MQNKETRPIHLKFKSMNKLDLEAFNKKFPLMKLFCVEGILYVYDSKSNLLAQVEENEIVDLIYSTNKDNLKNNDKNKFSKFYDKGVFLPGKLEQITPTDDEVNKIFEEDLLDIVPRKFIIEVTQDCNLRCKYCLFSNESSTRSHNVMTMSESMAKKAIDFYFKTYIDTIKNLPENLRKKICSLAKPNLSWWGGEPFLNFKLIKTTKKYFESLPWAKYGIKKNELAYTVVTNLTVFNHEILNFLIDNNVYLFVSIDGGKKEHDFNRVYKNNNGTFEIVSKNLDIIIKNHPNYSKNRVYLQAVKADNIDVKNAAKYIYENYTGKVLSCISYQHRHWGDNTPLIQYNEDISSDIKVYNELFAHFEETSEIETKKHIETYRDSYLFLRNVINLEKHLSFDNPKGTNYHNRFFSCPIGKDGIFCSADGKLHMCNKTDYSLPIGDLDSGIEKNIILEIYRNYFKLLNKNCTSCWAFRFCKMCPAIALEKGKFESIREDYCSITRTELSKQLYCYIILSNYPKAYNYISKFCNERTEKEKSFLTYDGPISINYLKNCDNEEN